MFFVEVATIVIALVAVLIATGRPGAPRTIVPPHGTSPSSDIGNPWDLASPGLARFVERRPGAPVRKMLSVRHMTAYLDVGGARSRATSHDRGATREYQGQTVSFEWQS